MRIIRKRKNRNGYNPRALWEYLVNYFHGDTREVRKMYKIMMKEKKL